VGSKLGGVALKAVKKYFHVSSECPQKLLYDRTVGICLANVSLQKGFLMNIEESSEYFFLNPIC